MKAFDQEDAQLQGFDAGTPRFYIMRYDYNWPGPYLGFLCILYICVYELHIKYKPYLCVYHIQRCP